MSQLAMELRDVPDHEVVGALMEQVLEHIVQYFEAAGLEVPGRRYLNVGQTAHDCEQLTVSFQQIYAGAPGDRAETPQKCNSPRSVVLTIQTVRRVALPAGRTTPPEPQEITDRTKQKTTDAWVMLDAALSLVDDYIGAIADVTVTNPSGEYQATVLNLTVGVP